MRNGTRCTLYVIWATAQDLLINEVGLLYLPTLIAAQKMLPQNAKVTFLADRGFGHGELMRWLNIQEWNWAIRLKRDCKVDLGLSAWSVEELLPPANVVYLYPAVEILGDISCNLRSALFEDKKTIMDLAQGLDSSSCKLL
jgi:hypothetical protein